ncbi:Riboflavin synthase [Arsenophonus endosymbiont of Aleurodicus dispersus]|uniref:riboflavin synthase subunit alpha n=1 Tax=Arsenophonus endosymbiont of Aleurodicus dispersus TaxID=235559 RepID=UPI000EACFB9A|nr:riboflavin synthase subunit alpha [Arsenophonus endosymbiont of Aleurodicus dispersus]VAY02271.1 Riboflavin synthase [Arsenophonus endosymbiont of Aleurodicus dispersus]
MYTGLVKGKATLVAVEDSVNFRTYTVQFPSELLGGLETGASVANNGCCLTVTYINGNLVSFDLMEETLRLTNLGSLKIGDMINLERSAKYGDEIGGHVMSGHIITTVEISKILKAENNLQICFYVHDKQLMKYIFHKGFIGVDGISLTVGNVVNNFFCVHLIPETIARTTIAEKSIGEKVNIEIDAHIQAVVETVERIMAPKK